MSADKIYLALRLLTRTDIKGVEPYLAILQKPCNTTQINFRRNSNFEFIGSVLRVNQNNCLNSIDVFSTLVRLTPNNGIFFSLDAISLFEKPEFP
jgi:hypothetical protein